MKTFRDIKINKEKAYQYLIREPDLTFFMEVSPIIRFSFHKSYFFDFQELSSPNVQCEEKNYM